MRPVIMAMGLLMLSSTAMARPRDKNGEEIVSTAQANDKDDKVICRNEEVVGTRLAKTRRCLKSSEWAELRRQNRMSVDRIQTLRWKSN